MKKIKIKVKVINDLNEVDLTDTEGEYDEENKLITYYDKNVFVSITLGEQITMKREHPNYNLSLFFKEKEQMYSKYEIFAPKSEFDVLVNTQKIEQFINGFNINYQLLLNNQDMGLFTIDFKWEE